MIEKKENCVDFVKSILSDKNKVYDCIDVKQVIRDRFASFSIKCCVSSSELNKLIDSEDCTIKVSAKKEDALKYFNTMEDKLNNLINEHNKEAKRRLFSLKYDIYKYFKKSNDCILVTGGFFDGLLGEYGHLVDVPNCRASVLISTIRSIKMNFNSIIIFKSLSNDITCFVAIDNSDKFTYFTDRDIIAYADAKSYYGFFEYIRGYRQKINESKFQSTHYLSLLINKDELKLIPSYNCTTGEYKIGDGEIIRKKISQISRGETVHHRFFNRRVGVYETVERLKGLS